MALLENRTQYITNLFYLITFDDEGTFLRGLVAKRMENILRNDYIITVCYELNIDSILDAGIQGVYLLVL